MKFSQLRHFHFTLLLLLHHKEVRHIQVHQTASQPELRELKAELSDRNKFKIPSHLSSLELASEQATSRRRVAYARQLNGK